ncbi:hypothetical protein M9434_000350 [Picochlorum sp. BPE23]|nr:hypothetical protein M9434_000350 [Picochlorum sp. BPE23]KAI8106386.1 hypothetical protein M9435_000930 [Picochlorum sp. BPE23]
MVARVIRPFRNIDVYADKDPGIFNMRVLARGSGIHLVPVSGTLRHDAVCVQCKSGVGRGGFERTGTKQDGIPPLSKDQKQLIAADSNHLMVSQGSVGFPWVPVLVTVGLTVSSLASMVTAVIFYMRPALKAMEQAALSAEEAAKDLEQASIEMEKTALMFQQDLPLTMKEVQKASEEWELVGKQLNVVFGSVARPLSVERPVEKAAESVRTVAQKSTARFSRRIVSETTAVANNLWTSLNQVAEQLGLKGVSNEAVEEAKRSLYIGRQQQEARTWIDKWRRKNALRESGKEYSDDVIDVSGDSKMSVPVDGDQLMSKAAAIIGDVANGNNRSYSTDDDPVAEVFSALAKAQAAAEEAAYLSEELERCLQKAEEVGMLSSSDEDDF